MASDLDHHFCRQLFGSSFHNAASEKPRAFEMFAHLNDLGDFVGVGLHSRTEFYARNGSHSNALASTDTFLGLGGFLVDVRS